MENVLHVELTTSERDVLLQGLRYVRRSIMLETREPVPLDEARRSDLLDDIQMLSQRLEATDPLTTADV